MPALKLFGRKWLAATDDLVYPGLFELFIRITWIILMSIACLRYYPETWKCRTGGDLVRVFLIGEMVILATTSILVVLIVNQSARGSIADTYARRYVQPLLTIKILLVPFEVTWNILGTIWIFSEEIECGAEHYTLGVVEALVLFDWVLIGLTILGLALIFDPLGSLGLKDKELEDSIEHHGKVSRIWLRRFKFFWWMRQDESASETFQHVAGLLSALFRGTDLVPSDVMAGCVLLRVRQKRETLELRRLNILALPKFTTDRTKIFEDTPGWMSLEWAHHYMQLSIALYGWLFVLYRHACTGCFRLAREMTCCSCLRPKRNVVLDDNCCLCSLSGVKTLSKLSEEDILFASFRNHLCEIPFCVLADHKTSSIVVVIRGSLTSARQHGSPWNDNRGQSDIEAAGSVQGARDRLQNVPPLRPHAHGPQSRRRPSSIVGDVDSSSLSLPSSLRIRNSCWFAQPRGRKGYRGIRPVHGFGRRFSHET
uniref:Sn1-specific diacylglycerol lipase beta n=1 Tax=Trichogramma kaykai TaxID=54128 RepID=A0ABD2WN36_9HYME